MNVRQETLHIKLPGHHEPQGAAPATDGEGAVWGEATERPPRRYKDSGNTIITEINAVEPGGPTAPVILIGGGAFFGVVFLAHRKWKRSQNVGLPLHKDR